MSCLDAMPRLVLEVIHSFLPSLADRGAMRRCCRSFSDIYSVEDKILSVIYRRLSGRQKVFNKAKALLSDGDLDTIRSELVWSLQNGVHINSALVCMIRFFADRSDVVELLRSSFQLDAQSKAQVFFNANFLDIMFGEAWKRGEEPPNSGTYAVFGMGSDFAENANHRAIVVEVQMTKAQSLPMLIDSVLPEYGRAWTKKDALFLDFPREIDIEILVRCLFMTGFVCPWDLSYTYGDNVRDAFYLMDECCRKTLRELNLHAPIPRRIRRMLDTINSLCRSYVHERTSPQYLDEVAAIYRHSAEIPPGNIFWSF